MPTRKVLLNPHLTPVSNATGTKIVGFYCPVKGRGMLASNLERRPSLLKAAVSTLQRGGGGLHTLSERTRTDLHHEGILIRPDERSAPVRYRCDLNEYAESSAAAARVFSAADFIVNPTLVYQRRGGVPPRVSASLSAPPELDCSGPTAWAEDPFTQIIYPFSIAGDLQRTFEDFCVKRQSRSYNAAHIDALRQARILLTLADLRDAGYSLRRLGTELSSRMQRRQYLPLAYLVNPPHVWAFRHYVRRLLEEGWLEPPRDDVRLRMTRHNDPIARMLHAQMGPYFSNLMGAVYKPSFSFVATHRPGSRFKKHTDRAQCDLVCSLLLDYSPETTRKEAWPLYLSVRRGRRRFVDTPVKIRIGEALAFRGHTVPHYRPPLPANHSSSHILFCFVPSAFDGSLE